MKEICPKDQLTRQLYGKLADKQSGTFLCICSAAPFLLCELDVHARSFEILTVFSIHFFTASLLFSFIKEIKIQRKKTVQSPPLTI